MEFVRWDGRRRTVISERYDRPVEELMSGFQALRKCFKCGKSV